MTLMVGDKLLIDAGALSEMEDVGPTLETAVCSASDNRSSTELWSELFDEKVANVLMVFIVDVDD